MEATLSVFKTETVAVNRDGPSTYDDYTAQIHQYEFLFLPLCLFLQQILEVTVHFSGAWAEAGTVGPSIGGVS